MTVRPVLLRSRVALPRVVEPGSDPTAPCPDAVSSRPTNGIYKEVKGVKRPTGPLSMFALSSALGSPRISP
jgi:hypothetical protein